MNNLDTSSHDIRAQADTNPSGGDDFVILLVDSSLTANQHATKFQQEFNHVISAETVADAQKHLETTNIDCIISEYDLPDDDGLHFLETVRSNDPELPFIMWTASGDETIASKATANAITDYIIKPDESPPEYQAVISRIQYAIINSNSSRTPTSKTDRTLGLFSEVCDGLTTTDTIDNALQTVLHALCEHTDWVYSEIWMPNDQEDHLTCAASYANTNRIDEFRRITESITFAPEEGVPGRIWITDTEEWIPDVTSVTSDQYVRTVSAEYVDLKTAFGVPIRANGKIAAVLVCYLPNARQSVPQLRTVTNTIAKILGKYLTHERRDHAIKQRQERDLTERTKEQERDLQTERGRFQSVFDGAFDAMVIANDAGEYIDVNESATTLFDCTEDELLGKTIQDFAPDNFEFEKAWTEFQQAEQERGIFPLVRPDGSERIVEFAATTNIIPGEHLSILRDVTESKERELELRRKQENLKRTEQLSQSGGWVYDLDSETLYVTDGTRRLFEISEEQEWTLEESFEYYHPDDRDTIRQAFGRCCKEGEPYEIEVRIITETGQERWIHERGERITENGGQKIQGALRDITEQKRYQEALTGINTAARALLQADTDTDIAQTTVNVATDIFDVSGVAVYLYEESAEALIPVATSDGVDTILTDVPRFGPGDGVAWRVFAEQESVYFDDVRTADDVYNTGTPIRSELILPLGGHGILMIGDIEVSAFHEFTREIAEIMAATTEAALDRAVQVQELRERERDAHLQTRKLERVEQLNDELRAIVKAIVQAGSREAIKQITCNSLSTLDQFEHVWVGEPNLGTSEIEISATGGTPTHYLEAVSLELHQENTLPAVRAVQDRKPVTESNLASTPTQDKWRNTALLHNVRSVCSVPVLYDHVLYGVLTIYSSQPDIFDDLTTTVLTELGELIGYALNTINQRNALLTDGAVDLTCQLIGADDVFVTIASHLDTTIHIENISVRSEGTFLAHFVVENGDPDEIRTVIDDSAAIKEVQLISESDSLLFEAVTVGDCIATIIAELGANLHSVTVAEDVCELGLSISQDQDIQTFIQYLQDQYPDVEVLTQQETRMGHVTPWRQLLDETLTDRQRDLLRTAYYSGFFEQPRTRTGADIADAFGISQPAFSKQLRTAQQKLLTAILS